MLLLNNCTRLVFYAECRYADSVGIALEPTKMACAQHAERSVAQ